MWARVGDVECQGTVNPTLLDSLAEDLCGVEQREVDSIQFLQVLSLVGVRWRTSAMMKR